MKRRTEAYTGILDIFECLYTLDEEKSHRLIKEYPADIDDTIKSELTHLKLFVKNEEISPAKIFELLIDNKFSERVYCAENILHSFSGKL